MPDEVIPLDVVALTNDIPSLGLVRGQAGTVAQTLAPEVLEIEFRAYPGRLGYRFG